MPVFERGDTGSSMEDLARALDELTRGVAEANRLTQAAQRGQGAAAPPGAQAARGGALSAVGGAIGRTALGAASGVVGAAGAAGVAVAGQGLVSGFRGGGGFNADAGFNGAVSAGVGVLARIPVLGEVSGASAITRVTGDAAANTFARFKDLVAAGIDIDDELLNAGHRIETAVAERHEGLRQRIAAKREADVTDRTAGQGGRNVGLFSALQSNPAGVALAIGMALQEGKTVAQALDGFRLWK